MRERVEATRGAASVVAWEAIEKWLDITLGDATTCAHLHARGLISWPHVRILVQLYQGKDVGPEPDLGTLTRRTSDTIVVSEDDR